MILSTITTKKPFKSLSIRRSARPSKTRDFYLTQFRIGRKLFYKTDSERGLNQPGGKFWSQKELNLLNKSHTGKQLFKQYLTEAKWKWKRSKLGEFTGYVCVAPNIPKASLVKNLNYFMSYIDIYDQYCKDGSSIEQVLKRGSKFAACSNRTRYATSTDDLEQMVTIHAMKVSDPEENIQGFNLSNQIFNGDIQNENMATISPPPCDNEQDEFFIHRITTPHASPTDHGVDGTDAVDSIDLHTVAPDEVINEQDEFFIHRITTPHASPTDHGEDGTDAVDSIDLHTVAPDEVIIPRLERIEYTLGVPKTKYLQSKVYQRLTMLEEDCGVEVFVSQSTTAKTSFLRRVELLESVIGI